MESLDYALVAVVVLPFLVVEELSMLVVVERLQKVEEDDMNPKKTDL